MLKELKNLYEKLEELKIKRASKEQKIQISERIRELLDSLVEELNDYF